MELRWLAFFASIGGCMPDESVEEPCVEMMRFIPLSDNDGLNRPRLAIGIIGQSGAAGRGNTLFLSPPSLQTLLTTPNPRVNLYDIEYSNQNPLGDPLYDYLRPLQPRPFTSPTPNMGSELSLGNYVDGVQSCFDIFKFSVGGTSLAIDWDPNGNVPSLPAGTPNLAHQAVARFKQGEKLTGSRLAAIFDVQGESDALDPVMAANYETNLTNYIAFWRQYWPGIPFGISRISEQLLPSLYLYKELVRTAQVNVATNVPGCFYVDTDDLTLDSFKEYVPNSYAAIGYRAGPYIVRRVGLTQPPVVDFTVQKSALSVQFTDLTVEPNAETIITSRLWDFGDGTTSTSQNPLHLYAGNGAYVVTLTETNSLNRTASITQTITVATPTWTVDATSGKGWPSTAAEWTALNTLHQLTANGIAAPAPDNLYLFQEAAGAIVDQIGGKNLAVTGTPAYQTAITGWSRKAIVSNGTATSQNANSTTMPNINASSVLVLAYFRFNSTAFFRPQLAMGGSAVNEIECDLTKLRLRTGTAINGLLDHAGTVHPIVLQYDNEDQINNIYSDVEKVSLAYASASGTSLIATFNTTSDAAASTDHLGIAVWRGAGARRSALEIKRLLQALAWATSGY